MTEHDVKCWPEFFADIASGAKPFEIRNDDRNYQVGDSMRIREWRQDTKEYTGRFVLRLITYKLSHRPDAECAADFGLQPGYAILGAPSLISCPHCAGEGGSKDYFGEWSECECCDEAGIVTPENLIEHNAKLEEIEQEITRIYGDDSADRAALNIQQRAEK